MSIRDAAPSAVLQAVVLGGLPFLLYGLYQRRRFSRTWVEIARRAGLQVGESRYLLLSGAVSVLAVVLLVVAAPPLEPLTRKGSAQHQFVGLGFTGPAVALALLNGVIQTSFTAEFLFRGLLAGSLGRRMSLL